MNLLAISEPSVSWGWPFAAAIGGIIVSLGLLIEKVADWMDENFIPQSYKPHKRLENIGWTILMVGILVEVGVGFALARKDEQDINAAKNATLNANISDMSATVVFFVKETQYNELTNSDNAVSKHVGTMYLFNKKGEMGYAFDSLTADNLVRKNGFLFGEPNMRDNRGYSLQFHSDNWNAFMGVERQVKEIHDLHWIRMDINFLPNGAKISDGAVELVVNNVHKFFHIFPQTDTNPAEGTPSIPYEMFATNVDETPVP
jgi:hypothetical protein